MSDLPPTTRAQRLTIAIAMSVAGVLAMCAVNLAVDLRSGAVLLLLSAAIGGFLSGALFADYFQRWDTPRKSWQMAAVGAVLATLLGSAFGGLALAVILMFSGGDFGLIGIMPAFAVAAVMVMAPAEEPLLIPLWSVSMMAVWWVAVFARSRF